MEITGKSALIFGGTSGLGLAVVKHLHARGARVAIMGRRGDLAKDFAGQLHRHAIGLECDVTSAESVDHAVATARERFGAVHIAVVTAGIFAATPVLQSDGAPPRDDDFARVVTTNLVGTWNAVTHAAAAMRDNGADEDGEKGAIVMTASLAAQGGLSQQAAYSAAKGGVVAMMRSIMLDLAGAGIRINTVVPGLFHTPMYSQVISEEEGRAITAATPNPRRPGRPEEFARAVEYLITTGYANGTPLPIHGGYQLGSAPLTGLPGI